MQTSTEICITELLPPGILRFSGPDAHIFLQGQITANVDELDPTTSSLAAHCNLKGRMQSLFRIFVSLPENQANYYLIMPAAMIPSALEAFKKYALFSKVQIEDLTPRSLGLGISGNDAKQILAKHTDLALYGICHISGTEPRFEVYGPSEQITILLEKLSPFATQKSSEFWALLDIQDGIPCVYPQTQDQLLPHHVNLVELKGISFNKGCYLGQEIIARMHYRGNVKKHMYRAFVKDTQRAPAPGDPVFISGASSSEAPGIVVRAAQSGNGYALLVVIEDQYVDFEKVHLYAVDGPKLSKP